MNKEEKEAINRIQKRIKDNEDYSTNQVWLTEDVRCARVVLNLIQKQDKIIDKFSKALVNCVGTCPIDYNDDFENDCENCQDTLEKCWIEFFRKEVEKDVED